MDLVCEEEMLPEDESPGAAGELGAVGVSAVTLPHPNFNFHEEMLTATIQPALISDPRVLQSMLQGEEIHMPAVNYFKTIQSDLTPNMRRDVATWMYEVCEEERVPESVFLRAINYVDRFLSVHTIQRNQFQLLGAACLLISSKWSGSLMSTQRLIFYTAHSVTLDMLLEWEMMILAQLKWDTFAITPSEFVELLLHRLPDSVSKAPNIRDKIRTFSAYCATDYSFSARPPSMIASASIAAALGNQVSQEFLQEVLQRLHQITNIETDVLKSCVEQIQSSIQAMMMENSAVPGPSPGDAGLHGSLSSPHRLDSHSLDKLGELEQAETPTDVRDIHF